MRKVPKLISAYVKASNDRDVETFGTLFIEDAVVHDEGIEHRGVAGIQEWLASTGESNTIGRSSSDCPMVRLLRFD